MFSHTVISARGETLGRDYNFCPFSMAHRYSATVTYWDTIGYELVVILSFTKSLKRNYPFLTPDTPIFIWTVNMIDLELMETVNSVKHWICKFQVIWTTYYPHVDYLEGIYIGRD